jgi:hypothetical protein
MVRQLVRAGADLNVLDAGGKTALMGAAENGHINVVAALLELGAERHLENANGETALAMARREAWPDVLELLERAHGEDGYNGDLSREHGMRL